MKSLFTLLLLTFSSLAMLHAQQPNPKKFTNVTWLLTADEMIGIGIHNSLEKDIRLQFLPDGKWTTTHPLLNNETKGTWAIDKKGKMYLKAGGKMADVVSITDDKLVIQLGQTASRVTWTWETPK